MKHSKIVFDDRVINKTCFLNGYTINAFPREYILTVFDNYFENVMRKEQALNLQFYGTSVQKEYKKLHLLCYF
jgi:GTPase SAR1 family protein